MPENTGISSVEKTTNKSNINISPYTNVLMCKCGKIDEFVLKFNKKYVLSFACMEGDFELSELNNIKTLSQKCKDCQKQIIIMDDFCEINNKTTIFFCKSCEKKEKNKNLNLIKISDIISKENEDTKKFKSCNYKQIK